MNADMKPVLKVVACKILLKQDMILFNTVFLEKIYNKIMFIYMMALTILPLLEVEMIVPFPLSGLQ